MNSRLAHVPIASRRRLAATVGLFAVLFLAVGAVAATGRGTAAAPFCSAVALTVAVLLGLIAWGLAHSIRLDRDAALLDTAITDTLAERHAALCTCGVEHDANALHVTDAEVVSCAHDGSGGAPDGGPDVDCAHDCDTCLLAAMRPSPTRTRGERLER